MIGGSGVSFAISHLLQIIRDARDGKSRVRTVRIVWMVKSRRMFPKPVAFLVTES